MRFATRFFTFQQRLHGQQARVAGVHVAADGEQALGNGHIAVAQRALDDVVLHQRGLQLAPQRDALQQRAAFVDARPPVGERGVHVEVRVAEGRGEEVALRVHGLGGRRRSPSATSVILPPCTATDMFRAAVGEGGVGDEEVEHGRMLSAGASGAEELH
jgi:hypothetical protein